MKKTIFCFTAFVLFAAGLFAQEEKGFSVTIDIDADLVQYLHTEIKNDEYISDEDTIQPDQVQFMHNSSFNDAEIKVSYTDPNGNFGGVVGLDFDSALTGSVPWGDFYAWGKLYGLFRMQLGKYSYRAIEKIGGDKDLGVLFLDISKKSNTFTVETTDSLAQQAGIIGFLGQVLIGPAEIGFFAAPDAYFVARHFQVPGTGTGDEPEQTIPAYYAYNFGGNAKVNLTGIANIGASYRQIHTVGEASSTGDIYNDFGLYAATDLNILKDLGLTVGLGYSGRISFEDGDDASTAPVQNAIHLDIEYRNSGFGFTAGLYNNISFYTLKAENLSVYDPAVASIANIYTDESSLALYNELKVSYAIPAIKLTPSLIIRNYYGTKTGFMGVKGADYSLDILTVEARAAFTLSENTEIRAGLKFTNTAYNTPKVSDVLVNSNFAVAIPVGITLKW
jgi:hypothetical protein